MKRDFLEIADLKLCTDSFFIRVVDKVSRKCGLYTCCRCNTPLYTLCATCEASILYATPACPICEKFSVVGVVHESCSINALYFTHTFSCFYYTKTIKCLLHLYKYSSAFQYQRVIEELICHYFRTDPFRLIVSWKELLINRRVAFVPVPMTKRKQEDRGFSPAYEFTIIFARILHKMFCINLLVFPRLLKKNNDKETQAKKSRQKRLLSLQRTYSVNATSVKDFCDYNPEVLIIVDDILTTGSTTTVVIDEIAKNEQLHQVLQGIPILRFTFAQA